MKKSKHMAKAIWNNVVVKENCVYYIKELAELEKEEVEKIRQAELEAQNIRNEKLEDIIVQFKELREYVGELNHANEVSANETNGLDHQIQNISDFCQELENSLVIIMNFIDIYKKSNDDFSEIAEQTERVERMVENLKLAVEEI